MDSLLTEAKNSHQIFLKTNPINLLTGPALTTFLVAGEAKLLGEYQVGKNSSVEIAVSYLFKSPFFEEVIDTFSNADAFGVFGFRGQVGYRFYLLNKLFYNAGLRDRPNGITGIYIGPHASYAVLNVTDKAVGRNGNYLQFSLFDATIDGGLQLKYNNFILDTYLGLGYKENNYNTITPNGAVPVPVGPEFDLYFNNPLKLRIGFHLGFRL